VNFFSSGKKIIGSSPELPVNWWSKFFWLGSFLVSSAQNRFVISHTVNRGSSVVAQSYLSHLKKSYLRDFKDLPRLPKGMAFIPFLSLFIPKDRENFGRGRKCCLSFAIKRDKKGIKAIPFGSLDLPPQELDH
jgi:hypothetical protein